LVRGEIPLDHASYFHHLLPSLSPSPPNSAFIGVVNTEGLERYSIPYFLIPNYHTRLLPLVPEARALFKSEEEAPIAGDYINDKYKTIHLGYGPQYQGQHADESKSLKQSAVEKKQSSPTTM